MQTIESELVKLSQSKQLEMLLLNTQDYPLYLQGFACSECGAHPGEECQGECERWQQ